MISQSGLPVPGIIVGVDTHKDEHVAVAINKLGARIGQRNLPTTSMGYINLESWANSLGEIEAFGIEGTGSYGAGLSRFLSDRGHRIIEVNRPDRSTRRRIGKSDPTDAEMAARAVLAGVAREEPKSGVDTVEMIRMIKTAKDSAMKGRTQSINQMKALVVTAPAELRSALRDLTTSQLIARCARWRPGKLLTATSAAKYTLWSLARRHIHLAREIEALDVHLARLTAAVAPRLTQSFGIGPDIAAALLVTAGSNPERLKSEASFAALCGVNLTCPPKTDPGKMLDLDRIERGICNG